MNAHSSNSTPSNSSQESDPIKPLNCRFVDSHCHFDFACFDKARSEELGNCAKLGIDAIIIPAVEPAALKRQFEIIENSNADLATSAGTTTLYGAVGLHPAWAHQYKDHDKALVELSEALQHWSSHAKCIAIGESGLDKFAEASMALQTAAFVLQLEFAKAHKLPTLLHVRGAHNEMLQLLKKHPNPAGGIVHGFSGSPELAQSYWRLGYRLGIGGVITYSRASKTRLAVQHLPLDAMVLETDAPDMPLVGFQGQDNKPSKLIEVAQCLAQLKNCSLSEVAVTTTDNCRSLFTF